MFGLYPKFRQKSSSVGFFLLLAALMYPGAFAAAQTPNDPKYPLQESFYNQINAPAAWNYTIGSSNVVVAIIDTGVDIVHEDLKENIWLNSKEVFGNGVDDDGNGYIDDMNGWDFVENSNDVGISVIQEVDDSGAVSHGTVLAGLIGAVGNNGVLGTGLNWQVKIMPLRAIDSGGGGSLFNVAKAINYAVNNGADIISISFVGNTTNIGLQESLRHAHEKGVLVVAAAGNNRDDGTGTDNLSKKKQYPICGDSMDSDNWILGVTSVDQYDRLSTFANYGSCVDLVAPGENIFSTQKYAPQYGYNKNFDGAWFGSSFSAPLVAGSAALIKAIRPDWKAKQIISTLLSTVDDIDSLNPNYLGQIGYGRLNVGKAVARAVESKEPVIPPFVFDSKLVKKDKKYFVRITSEGKVLHDLPLPGYSPKTSKWAVIENLLIMTDFNKKKITVNAWDWSGKKQLSNLVLAGIDKLDDLKIDKVWGDSPNAILLVKQAGEARRLIIDLPSQSWKTEMLK